MSVSSTRCYRRYSWDSKHNLSPEGFGAWPLRGNTHGREWYPAGLKVCLCVISMYRLLSGPGRWLSRVCKEVAAYYRVLLKNQHSWEHQTEYPDLGMSNLINFICIATETNMLPVANPRSQKLRFLIIIAVMSYTYSRLVFWLSKKQVAKMSKCSFHNSTKRWLFLSVWRSSQSVENYPFFFEYFQAVVQRED